MEIISLCQTASLMMPLCLNIMPGVCSVRAGVGFYFRLPGCDVLVLFTLCGAESFFNSIGNIYLLPDAFFSPLCFGIYLTVLVCINNVCLCLVLCCNVLHITKPLLKPHIFRCDDCVWFLKRSQGVTRAHPQLLHTMSCCELQLCCSRYDKVLSSIKVSLFII